jgi:hypothetical protein
MAQTLSASDVNMLDAMMSPLIPMTVEAEEEAEEKETEELEKMDSDTQILLAVFEKVVRIEKELEGKGSASAPSYSGNLSPQLEF